MIPQTNEVHKDMARTQRQRETKPAVEESKTYLLEIAGPNGGYTVQRKKVTVPSSWKITYGPAAQGAHLGGQNPFVLRFYEGQKEHMRALFHNVVSFRDVTIKVEEEVEKVQAETLLRDTPNGRKNVVVEGRVKEWRDADSPDAGVLADQNFLHAQPQLVAVNPFYPGMVPTPAAPFYAPQATPPGFPMDPQNPQR